MKKVSFSLVISILMICALVTSAIADVTSLPGTGWWTGETIQNVGHTDETVNVTAYDSASSATYLASKLIQSGGSENFLPGDFAGMGSDFEGSGIVDSVADIRAIVNVTNRTTGDLGDPLTPSFAAGQYQGMLSPATTIVFPLFKNDSFTKSTTLYIQNAGDAAATAQAVFRVDAAGGGGVYTYTTPSMDIGQMVVVTPAMAGVPTSKKGGATVTSTEELAGVVLEHFTSEVHATIVQATRAFTLADYDDKLYAPTNKKNRLGRFTGMNIQNVDTGDIDVTVTYYGNRGTCVGSVYTDTREDLAPGEAHTFSMSSATMSPAMPDECASSAVIVATEANTSTPADIVGQVNESWTGAYLSTHPGQQQESTIYSCIADKYAATVVSVPIHKEGTGNKYTGINVMNTSLVSDAHVVLIFTNKDGTVYQINPYTIGPGNAQSFQNLRLPAGTAGTTSPAETWNGTEMTLAALGCAGVNSSCPGNTSNFGVIITSDVPVVAIANEATWPLTSPPFAQDKNNYEGFNLAEAP